MKLFRGGALFLSLCSAFVLGSSLVTMSAPVVLNTNLQIRLVLSTSVASQSVRIAKDPRNNQLYYLKINGDIYQVNLQPGAGSTSTKVYSSANHGLSSSVEGLAIG